MRLHRVNDLVVLRFEPLRTIEGTLFGNHHPNGIRGGGVRGVMRGSRGMPYLGAE